MVKPKTARKPTDHRFQWRDIKLRVRHTPDYINPGWSVLEIHVVAPKGAPIPITDTGYRSQFLDEAELKAAGGPVAYVRAWLDAEAKTKRWHKAEFNWRQGDFFGDSSM